MINIPVGYKKEKNKIIPNTWKFFKVKDVLEKVGTKVDVQLQEKYQQIGIRSHGKGLFYKDYVTGSELGNKSVFWIEEDCFIVNIVFAWEQAISRTTKNEIGMICSHRFPMYKPIDNRVDIDYLVYFFNTPYGKKVLELASPGGAGRNKTLGQKEFANSEILLPISIDEQKKIVDIISRYDLLIKKQQNLIANKDKFKRAIMQRLFNEKLSLNTDRTIIWDKKPINKLAKIGIGKTPDRECSEYWGYGFKWLSIGDMKSKYIGETKERITEIAVERCKMKLLPENTLVMSFKLTLGRVGILNEAMYTNEAICNFEINNTIIDREYLYYYLDSIDVSKFGSLAAKGITLNQETLSGIIIRYPSLEEQVKIAQILIAIDKEIELLKKELDQLIIQKTGMMQKLLFGEVIVKI